MNRAGWVGGVVLLVCCAVLAVLSGGSPRPSESPSATGGGWELTGQDVALLDHRHANAVSSCTSVAAKWPDPLSGCQWYLSDSRAGVFDINVEEAWAATLGEGVRVLVVDYPVDYRHEDLRGNMDPAASPGLTEAAVTGSPNSHGTAMASIIAARDNAVGFRGVAPRASLTSRGITSADIARRFALPSAECVEAVTADGSVEGSWAQDCRSSARAPASARFFTFALDAPSRVTIDLRSSLDTFLYVRSGHFKSGTPVVLDDDGGSGLNARVSRTFPAGVYTIEATTFAHRSRPGSFTLQVAGLDGASVPEPAASERRWASVWDTLLEAAVVNRSYSTASRTAPYKEGGSHLLSPYEIYDTMAEFGFGGRGTLNVLAGGKTIPDPAMVYWSTLAEDRSHPAVVVVCATDREGRRDARHNTSIEGPSLWVCAPVGGMVYANLGDRYHFSGGTPSSPATALVSGVAALVRSIDSNLSWRDVKLILAASAQHNDPGDAGWQQGAAVYGAPGQSYRYHHSYGFGVVDAGAAVELAQSWRYLPAYRSEDAPAPALSPALAVPDDATTVTAALTADPEIDFVEYVEAHLDLDAPWFRDLEVELVSPSGAVSTLSVPVGNVTDPSYAPYDCKQASECGISGRFRFGTAAHLGEDPDGMWTLRLTDRKPNGNTNTLRSWSLRFFGHKSSDPSPALAPSPTFGPWPQASITAGPDIDEGGDAAFTVTADPAPASALLVYVTVTQTGDFGVSPGSHTVTVPASGTATLTVATDDDTTGEPDGSVTVTLRTVGGYTVSATAGTAAVAVRDDDATPVSGPEVSITAGADITEGGDAVFTVSADPAPTSPLTVDVTVAAAGDFGVSPGSRTVTIPMSGSAVLTVATAGDSADEADGSVTATVSAGSGYTVSATAGSASVAVADDDSPVSPPVVCVPSLPSDAVTVSVVTGWRDQYSHAAHQQRWDRVLAALGVDNGAQAMTVADAQAVKAQFDNARWDRTVRTLEAMAQCDGDPPPAADPEVSVTAGGSITEGGSATFTVTADPAPTAPLSVEVTVSQSGDFGVSPGSRTVTVPASGSVTLTVATTDDSADEADGSVTATLSAGSGYTVSATAGTATVAVADDDDPAPPPPPPADPEVSITAGAGVTEGGGAAFTVTADPAPAAALTVTVSVAQSGDFGVSPGSRTVTVPASGSVTLTVATVDDSADEADGSVTVTVDAGSGYTVSQSAGTATVAVADDDDPPPPPADPGFAVHDAAGAEGGTLRVRVTLSGAPRTSKVEVYWMTFAGSGGRAATPGADYSTRARGWLAFDPGDTEKWVQVPLLEDDSQEPPEHFLVRLLRVSPYRTGPPIADGRATMTITDND